jgi:hypothetical protein
MVIEAQLAQLRYETAVGKLYRAEDIEFVITQIFTAVKNKLLALPSRTSRLVIGKSNLGEIVAI